MFCLSICAAVVLSVPANASLLGDTLSWQSYFGGGEFHDDSTSGSFVVDGGIGGTMIVDGVSIYNLIALDDRIGFDYLSAGTWGASPLSLAPTIFNGVAINKLSGFGFASVGIHFATNLAGFDASRISFTPYQIQIDWQGLSFDANTLVKLNITTATPEPAAYLLLGSGLIALAAWGKRKAGRARL